MANIGITQNAAMQIMDILQKAENTLENANSITANVQNSLEMEVASRANIDTNLTAIRRAFDSTQERINRVISIGREAVNESDRRDHAQQQRTEQIQMNSAIPALGGAAAIGFLGLHGAFSSISNLIAPWINNRIAIANSAASLVTKTVDHVTKVIEPKLTDLSITERFSEFAATKGPMLKNDYYDENGRWKSSGCCAFVDYAYEDVYGRSWHSITNDEKVQSAVPTKDVYGFLKDNGARAGDVLWCHNGGGTTHYMIVNDYDEEGVWITDGYFKNGKMTVWCNNEKVSYTGSGGHAQAYFNGSCYLTLYKEPDEIRKLVHRR